MTKFSIFNQQGVLISQAVLPSQEGELWLEREKANGSFGLLGQFSVSRQVVSEEEDPRWIGLRNMRNARLAECDWAVLPDSPLTTTKKQKFLQYRQALRDLPAKEGLDPENPSWPKKP